MRKIFILSIVLSNSIFHAQVGINTTNPQGIFHVDAQSNNEVSETPSVQNQTDDFIVTNNGRVGIGTINPRGALEINSSTLGVAFPRLSAEQRDAISIGSRPPGTVIYNLSISRLEVNTGTDNLPIWTSLGEITSSSTINTTATYLKTAEQNFTNTQSLVNYDTNSFNNTPTGYITKMSNQQFRLASGKSYKIEINSGSVRYTRVNSLNCSILSNDVEIGRLRAYPTTFAINVSGPNNTIGFVDLNTSSDDVDITIGCRTGADGSTATLSSNGDGGSYAQPYPYITFTILN